MLNRKLGLFALITLMLAFHTEAKAQEPAYEVHVVGESAVSLVPDAFTVTFVIEERGETVTKLNELVRHRLDSIVSFLQNSGVKAHNIQSMEVNLTPWVEHTSNGRQDRGYILSREVRVTSTQINSYDKLLDGVLSRGVTRIQGFEFINSQEATAFEQALEKAVEQGKARAQRLANQAGMTLGDVKMIQQVSSPSVMPVARMDLLAESKSLPGTKAVSAKVNLVFTLKPKQ